MGWTTAQLRIHFIYKAFAKAWRNAYGVRTKGDKQDTECIYMTITPQKDAREFVEGQKQEASAMERS